MSFSIFIYADTFSGSGEGQKAVELLEHAIQTLGESSGSGIGLMWYGKTTLVGVYCRSYRSQEVVDFYQQCLES